MKSLPLRPACTLPLLLSSAPLGKAAVCPRRERIPKVLVRDYDGRGRLVNGRAALARDNCSA